MSSLPLREAARAIVLDSRQRVLLLAYDENGGFWATPGGSLEPGEDHRTAVIRELSEEIGARNATLVAQVAERAQEHLVGIDRHDADDTFITQRRLATGDPDA